MGRKVLVLISLVVGVAGCAALNQTNPFSESHEWFGEGLPLLRKVSDRLYVGGQPSSDGLAKLKGMGVKTVINVRESWSADRWPPVIPRRRASAVMAPGIARNTASST